MPASWIFRRLRQEQREFAGLVVAGRDSGLERLLVPRALRERERVVERFDVVQILRRARRVRAGPLAMSRDLLRGPRVRFEFPYGFHGHEENTWCAPRARVYNVLILADQLNPGGVALERSGRRRL
jgi:hypothetical protein